MALADDIANFTNKFRQHFFRGIPCLLNADGAYLSFGCTFSGTEALAGYRFPGKKHNSQKFKSFLLDYYDSQYHPFAEKLWGLRNSLIHGFSPKHFGLCHWQPTAHFTDRVKDGVTYTVLNADSLFLDFQSAAERYFSELSSSSSIQAEFEQQFTSGEGGGLYVS